MGDLEKLAKTIDKLELNSKKLESYENLYSSLKSIKEDVAKNIRSLNKNESKLKDISYELSKSLSSIKTTLTEAVELNKENLNEIKSSLNKVKKQNQSFAEEIEELKEKRKIVCSMMNEFYGFGYFRNKIWLEQSKNLDPAYQKGYHMIFLPLVKFAKGKKFYNRIIRFALEHIAKHRTVDIWAQKRGRRHILGMIYRLLIEPICFICGRLKGNT
jgi:hypothetical protein